jgi:outer membrane protein assembly factor BamB
VRRAVLTCALFALVGCDSPEDEARTPTTWVYPPSVAAWPIGVVTGTIGRSQAPQLVEQIGVRGTETVPLRAPTPWGVPGEGRARAVVYGLAEGSAAVEMIDVDEGRIVWRTTACGGPIVGVTEEVVVCADATGTRAITVDGGERRWDVEAAFVAMTEGRVVVAGVDAAGGAEAVILDAQIGDELARVKLPAAKPARGAVGKGPAGAAGAAAPPIAIESIVASCGDTGRELFAYGESGELVRIAEAAESAGAPKIMWSVALPAVAAIDACDGASVLVTTTSDAGPVLVALSRETGKPTGRIERVRGFWPARDGSARLEVSTDAAVAIHARDLAGPGEPTTLPRLAELLSERGEQRLVRATKRTAAVLDRRGVRAYVPLAASGAVLGDQAIVAASWYGSPGETVHRFGLPGPYPRELRVPMQRPPVAVTAELRDLPALVEVGLGGVVVKPDTGKYEVSAIALDPVEPAVYVSTLEAAPDEGTRVGLSRFDVAARAWTWYREDGCGAGTPAAIAAARDIVVCAARGARATVVATTRDGNPLWQWSGDNVDALQAAADVVLVHDAERLYVLDARDGALLAAYASDDGGPMRAAALDVAGMTMVVVYQRGLVLARLPRVGMVPAWTLAVAGVVRALVPAGDGVLVDLEDGDAYRVDARSGEAVALPGLDLAWGAHGDVVTGEAPGGPVPAEAVPVVGAVVPAVVKRPVRRGPPPRPRDPAVDPPRLPKPWPAPPPMAASWQLTVYELSGALRARNDYALDRAVTPDAVRGSPPLAARGPGDSPIVVPHGRGWRELLVIEPRTGDPVRRVQLPEDAASGTAFSTMVDGRPVVGAMLANPLRAVVF